MRNVLAMELALAGLISPPISAAAAAGRSRSEEGNREKFTKQIQSRVCPFLSFSVWWLRPSGPALPAPPGPGGRGGAGRGGGGGGSVQTWKSTYVNGDPNRLRPDCPLWTRGKWDASQNARHHYAARGQRGGLRLSPRTLNYYLQWGCPGAAGKTE